ncbi:hypothetical protein GCM10023310_00430 [Paenibacillus vulneris]
MLRHPQLLGGQINGEALGYRSQIEPKRLGKQNGLDLFVQLCISKGNVRIQSCSIV